MSAQPTTPQPTPAQAATPAPAPLPGGIRPVPPTGFAAVVAAARSCPTGTLRGKRLAGLAFLVGLPLLIQVLFLAFAEGRGSAFSNFARIVGNAYLHVILPLTLVFLGTAALGDEWEGGTAHWVVGQPLPRWTIVLGRLAITVGRALVLALPALVLLYVLCAAPFEGALVHYLPALAAILFVIVLTVLGYASIFLFLGLALRRSVMTSMIYVLIFEGFIGSLPSGFSTISLAFHARNLLWLWTGEKAFEPPPFLAELVEPVGALGSLLTMLVFSVAWTALAAWWLARKEVTSGGPTADAGGS